MITLPQFMFAGNATFTVTSKKTGDRFTFKVRKPSEEKPHFVSVLTGSDNEHSYTPLAHIVDASHPSFGVMRFNRNSRISPSAPSAKAFDWLFRNLDRPEMIERFADIHHEGKCCRCGRKLTVPSSVESGIGPECAGKI